MLRGHGVDIVEIRRLEKAVERWGDLFLERVFTVNEIAYSRKKHFPFQHLAARFAAKEAVFKALGTRPALNFKDIEITNDQYGRPCCSIKNKLENILLSISHTHDYAVASAIIP